MDYLVGDLQGCVDPLDRLLATIDFSPSRDTLVVLGDLINRGPSSLQVLRRLHRLGSSARCLLGNHDLHFLAVAHGVRRPHRNDTLDELLAAPDREHWVTWLRHQSLAMAHCGWLCVHAGVLPQWSRAQVLQLAQEVESLLRGADFARFVQVMYGNEPQRWRDDLTGDDRARCIINVLTRIRFCRPDGEMEFTTKSSAAVPPSGFMPWFDAPERQTRGEAIAFGHWSTLGLIDRSDLLSLDTGCVWGGNLSAARVDGGRREVVQIPCTQAQAPGN